MNNFASIMHNRRFEIRCKDGEWQVRSYVPNGTWRDYDQGVITFRSVERAVAFAQALVKAIEEGGAEDAGC